MFILPPRFLKVLGLALTGAGAAFSVNSNCVTAAIPSELESIKLAPIFTIVIGCIIFCIAFMGCWGAITRDTCLLTTFAVILLIIFIIQIAIGVFAFWIVKNSNKWKTSLENDFKEHISDYNHPIHPSNVVIDKVQMELECCGANGPKDYEADKIPSTCCLKREDSTAACIPYEEGCVDKIFNFLWKGAHTVAYVLIIAAIVEVVSATFAICLTYSIRNEDKLLGSYE